MGFFRSYDNPRPQRSHALPAKTHRRVKPSKAVTRLADLAVILAFKDIQQAQDLRDRDFAEATPLEVNAFERQAWNRLLRYLTKLPPPEDLSSSSR